MFSAVERRKKHQRVMVFITFQKRQAEIKTHSKILIFYQICCNGPKYRKFTIEGLVPKSEYLRLAKVKPTLGFLQGLTVLNRS